MASLIPIRERREKGSDAHRLFCVRDTRDTAPLRLETGPGKGFNRFPLQRLPHRLYHYMKES